MAGMGWHAVEAIDAAVTETKELLLPFDWWLWAKVAVIVFFVSGFNAPSGEGVSALTGGTTGGEHALDQPHPEGGVSPTGMVTVPTVEAVAVILAVLLGAVFVILGAVFRFVFYQSLLDRRVRIRANVSRHFWNGIQLLAGMAVLALVGLLTLVIGVAAGRIGVAVLHPVVILPVVLLVLPLLLLVVVALQLTREFVPLMMIDRRMNIFQAWKTLYPVVRREWRETAAYIVVRFLLGLGIGIVVGIASLLVLLVFIIPVIAIYYAVGGITVLVGVFGGVAALFWLVITLYAVRVPAETYLQYYTILVFQGIMSEQ